MSIKNESAEFLRRVWSLLQKCLTLTVNVN